MCARKYRVVVPDIDYYQKNIKCQDACPTKTDARGYVNAISAGDYAQAYTTAREPNPFASTCGRICPAYCEQACRRGKIDKPVAIRSLKRFVTEKYGAENKSVPDDARSLPQGPAPGNSHTSNSARAMGDARWTALREGKVAVIGSGPGGLTAAHDLAILGYKVTIFEALPFPGGKWRIAIPQYRVPREVIDAEIRSILSQGIELKLNVSLGRDYTLPGLKAEGFKAIFLAMGAEATHKLSHPEEGIFGEADSSRENAAVVDAVAAGHAGARRVDGYLTDGFHWEKNGAMTPVESRAQLHPDYLFIERQDPAMSGFVSEAAQGEMEQPLSETEAKTQAQRCLRCNIQTVFDSDKCVLCGGCVDVCPKNCYKMVRLDEIQGDDNLRALVHSRYGKSLEEFYEGVEDGPDTLENATAIIKDETDCIRCGLCAKRCPVGAISMEAFRFEETLVADAGAKAEQPVAVAARAGGRR